MEMWVKVNEEKKKYQGSFRKVMEELSTDGKGKEVVLLSFHAPQKERRRLKRELRANGRDLVKTATKLRNWFYRMEIRKLRRKIHYLKRRAKFTSKGDVFYCSKTLERIKKLQEKIKEIDSKLSAA